MHVTSRVAAGQVACPASQLIEVCRSANPRHSATALTGVPVLDEIRVGINSPRHDPQKNQRCAGAAEVEGCDRAGVVRRLPDESESRPFRQLPGQPRLAAQMFATAGALLEAYKLLLLAGTIVDATIIAAPSSTKNATQTSDPAMTQTRKGAVSTSG